MSEARPLTEEEKQQLVQSPHFKLGLRNGVLFALLKAEEKNVQLPEVVTAYENDFGTYENRDKHLPSPIVTSTKTTPPPKKKANKPVGKGNKSK